MTAPVLWTSNDAKAAVKGTATADFSATGVSIDTRTLKKGEIYLALKGDSLDGHAFVDAAFKAGASAAIVSRDYKPSDPNQPLIYVDDTLQALVDLGQVARTRCRGKIIGVTGSAGKTGTKEMLAIAFGALGKTHASKKSFNNHWGVPLSLANLPEDTDFGIFEMGMNHAGELTVLSAQVKPDIVIITTIEPAHIEHFKTLEAIADAKAEIFTGMDKAGVAILNIDNPHFQRLKNAALKEGVTDIVPFGEDDSAKTRLIDCALHADSSKITAEVDGEKLKYKLNIPGRHIAMNSLAALSAVKAAGGDLQKAAEAISSSEPVEGRGSRILVTLIDGQPPVTIIDESYNANPGSMLAAFSVFEMTEPVNGGRRIAILGDMLELGKDGPTLHAGLANPLMKAKVDLLFCCGPQMEALYASLPPDWQGAHTKDSREISTLAALAVKPGDVVLIKGSAGSKMGYVVEALKALHIPPQKAPNKDHRNAL